MYRKPGGLAVVPEGLEVCEFAEGLLSCEVGKSPDVGESKTTVRGRMKVECFEEESTQREGDGEKMSSLKSELGCMATGSYNSISMCVSGSSLLQREQHPPQSVYRNCLVTSQCETHRMSSFKDVKNTAVLTPLLARSRDIALVPQYHSIQFEFSDFEYDRLLGTGVTAICVAARERRTNRAVALKILSKSLLTEREHEQCLLNEVELQSHLCHPNIVPLLTWFHDQERVALVMEYCNEGDLFLFLSNYKRRARIDERFASRLMFDVLWALRYCHANKIAHLDLKPENIMVNEGRLLLGDFGMSEHINSHHYGINKFRGTHDYWAPEQCVQNDSFGPFNHKADIWAIGVLLFEIYFGFPPFGSVLENDSTAQILQNIQTQNWQHKINTKISKDMYKFLNFCLQKHSHKRPTAEQLFDSPFVTKHGEDRLSDPLFIQQPYQRGTGFNSPEYF